MELKKERKRRVDEETAIARPASKVLVLLEEELEEKEKRNTPHSNIVGIYDMNNRGDGRVIQNQMCEHPLKAGPASAWMDTFDLSLCRVVPPVLNVTRLNSKNVAGRGQRGIGDDNDETAAFEDEDEETAAAAG